MCGSVVDVQSPTAENRRGKKKKEEEEERKKVTTAAKYNGLPIVTALDITFAISSPDEFLLDLANLSMSECSRTRGLTTKR